MTLLSLFATSFGVAFSGAMVPGPMLTVTIDESLNQGYKAGPLIVLGHALVELFLLIGLVWGLNKIIVIPWVQAVIAGIGGLFLLYMAYGILKGAGKAEIDLAASGKGKPGKNIVAKGILVSISNPYFILWWATLGLAYVTIALGKGVVGLGVFFFGHILADFFWYFLVAYLIGESKRFLSTKIYRILLFACGIFLAFLAVQFLYSGFSYVL
ncbi:LysE family transporter [Candidatus Formimonas warabiya]|uniref:Lysine transporter LysE n=1 Tax=Formimonas warabiya TaxID=1761012 RepID=A0A3G1KV28_FORW1|nr:LysE family transporter [Candidatus Formimonas warabiya]ATW26260.1 hypothetical protein DCMF_17190 [Candidatus Formimonas warabiya]